MNSANKNIVIAFPVIIFSLFLLIASSALAEWQYKGPGGTRISSILVDSTNSSIVYAGTNGGLFKSEDAGLTWTYKGLRFRGVDAIKQIPTGCSSAGALLAGSGNTLYSSSDGGESWIVVSQTNSDIGNIAISSSCITYVATEGDGIYISDGTNPPSHELVGQDINALSIDSNNTVYVGTDNGKVVKSTDNGANWNEILPDEGFIADIIALDPDHIFVASGPSGILETTDGGSTWNSRISGLPDVDGSGVHVVDSIGGGLGNTLYVAVITSSQPLTTKVYKSTNGGASWIPTNASATHEYEIDSIIANPADTVYLGTYYGLIKSTDGGSNWLDLTDRIDAASIENSMSEDSLGNIFVASDRGHGIYRSTDDGETWTPVGSGHPSVVTAVLVDRNDDTLYCGDEQIGGVYKSTDHGETWHLSSQGLPTETMGSLTIYQEIHHLSQGGNNRIYAGLWSEIYYSDDQGATWTAAADLPVRDDITTIVAGTGANVYVGTNNNGVFKSTDGGATWVQKNNGLPANPSISKQGIIFDHSAGYIYLSINEKNIYKSQDGGDTWEATANPVSGLGCGSNALAMDNSNNLFGVFCHGTVYKSTDSGTTWTEMSDGLGTMNNTEGLNITGIFVTHKDSLLLGTYNKGMYKFSDGLTVSFPWPSFLPAIISSHKK